MNSFSWHTEITELLKIALILVTGVLVIPLVIGFFHNITLIKMLGLVASILIFQPFAVVVGFGLGINPFPMMLIMCSIGISVILVLFGICDMFANRSEWTRKHLKKLKPSHKIPNCSENMESLPSFLSSGYPESGFMDAF